ncbi:MAG TPA: hypothetical protein VH138_00730 [Vicinamibacterales bacterium]|nr:hypothetical protein [Vicinamibacterales bacterium]
MALLAITILFGLSLLAALILFKVVIYEVPQGKQRMIGERGTPGLWQAT